eukprot:1784016-Rhodomonas_salina.5
MSGIKTQVVQMAGTDVGHAFSAVLTSVMLLQEKSSKLSHLQAGFKRDVVKVAHALPCSALARPITILTHDTVLPGGQVICAGSDAILQRLRHERAHAGRARARRSARTITQVPGVVQGEGAESESVAGARGAVRAAGNASRGSGTRAIRVGSPRHALLSTPQGRANLLWVFRVFVASGTYLRRGHGRLRRAIPGSTPSFDARISCYAAISGPDVAYCDASARPGAAATHSERMDSIHRLGASDRRLRQHLAHPFQSVSSWNPETALE